MALTLDKLQIQIEADSGQATSAIDTLIGRLESLQGKLKGLKSAGSDAGKGLKETAKGAEKAATATEKQNNATDKATKSTKSFSDKLAQQISKYRTLTGAFKSAANMMGNWFKESNDYIETLNLFNVTMGDAATSARKYAESVEAAMGIDSKDFMQYQGVFKNLTAGFGVVEKDANTMSQNLTQLSYDMASFFNTDVETAFDKLSSAMSGQVKGLREFGIDTSVATLQEYALSKGIDKSVRSMTQAEKSLLRYNYIMEQSSHVQGDMARTIITPANAMRVLEAQLTRMKRALGNIVSVLVTQVIPYVQAFVELVTEAANKIAKYFNFDTSDFAADTSGIKSSWGEAEESVDDYSESLKKAKKQMMGFDELNIIQNPNSDSGSADSGAGGGSFDMGVLEYDFLKGLKTEKLDEFKEKVKEIAKWVGVVATGLAGWKISSALFGVGTAFTAFAKTLGTGDSAAIKAAGTTLAMKFKKAFGVALMAAGAALDIQVAIESWAKGVKWDGLVKQLVGGGLLHLGGFLVGGLSGLGIGGMLDGILTLIPSIKSAIADGNKEWSNTLSIVKGIAALFGGLSVLLGNWIPIAIGGVITVVSLVAIYWQEIVNWFKTLPATIGGFFTDLWEGIKYVWGTVSQWFGNRVVLPVVGFFSGLWTSVSGFFSDLWEGIKGIWTSASTWFNDNVIQPIVSFFAPIVEWISTFFYGCWLIVRAVWVVVSDWFNTKVVQPIVEFFKQLWEDIKAVWTTVSTWFNENVITPVVAFFKKVWDKVSTFFVNLWEGVKAVWNNVSTWFNEKVVQPVVGYFKSVWTSVSAFFTDLWSGIKAVWASVSNWFTTKVIQPLKNAWDSACAAIGAFFTDLWSGIKKGVAGAMNTVIGGIESALNWVIGGINKLIGGFSKIVQWAAGVLGESWGGLAEIPKVSFKRVNYYELGGFPQMGEMFIARESGPELVGNIGRKTAVANNDQIISGIEAGVYRAMVAANSNSNGGGNQTIRIINEIDGDVVGEKVIKYHNGKVMQTGASPLLV